MSKPSSSILLLRIEIDGRIFEEDLAQVSFIQPDLEGLNSGLADNPRRFAWWGTMAEILRTRKSEIEDELRKVEKDFKEALNRVEGELFIQYARSPEHKGAKVDEIKGLVAIDTKRTQIYDDFETRRSTLRRQLTQAEHDYNEIKVGLDTISERSESLKEISRNMRSEMEQKLQVAAKNLRDFAWGKKPNS